MYEQRGGRWHRRTHNNKCEVSTPGCSGSMRVNSKGLPHLEQGGRNLFDIFVLSAIRGRYLTHPAWRGKTIP